MQIDLGTLVVIVALGAASPLIVDVVPRIVLPVVVVEILLGIVVGPPILGWIHVTGLPQVLADFGLAFLFFLAGFELDLDQLQGVPARLALTGWGMSVALALVVAGLLEALDVGESTLFVGVALTTTALGTLVRSCATMATARDDSARWCLRRAPAARWAPSSWSRCC